MLAQEKAVQQICESLKGDPRVKAVFLKGSMGRGEHDEHSDIDLYCLVDRKGLDSFLSERFRHLSAYREIIFMDDIFIVAPQLIAVFDDFLHIDLFTVTADTFTGKDFYKVLFDPEGILEGFAETQGLELTPSEYRDHINDIAWFLFQYKKAAARGNSLWAVKMLSNSMEHLARALLYLYAPGRAQLGLKALQSDLPEAQYRQVEAVADVMTPEGHHKAAVMLCGFISQELGWMMDHVKDGSQIERLMKEMLAIYSDGNVSQEEGGEAK